MCCTMVFLLFVNFGLVTCRYCIPETRLTNMESFPLRSAKPVLMVHRL